jgi:hypothetical protein
VFWLRRAWHLGAITHGEVRHLPPVPRLRAAGQRRHRAARRRLEGRHTGAARISAPAPAKGKKAAPPSDGDDVPASAPSDDDDEATTDASGPAADGPVADGPTADSPAADGLAGADAPPSEKSSGDAADTPEGSAAGRVVPGAGLSLK